MQERCARHRMLLRVGEQCRYRGCGRMDHGLHMKAKKKPLETITPEQLGVDVTPHLKLLKVEEPSKRQAGVRVADVQELVHRLRDEAKVI